MESIQLQNTESKELQDSESKPGWDYTQIIICLIVSLILQDFFLRGDIINIHPEMMPFRICLAILFDLMVIIRVLISYLRKETNKCYRLYLVLSYSSPVWITLVSVVVKNLYFS